MSWSSALLSQEGDDSENDKASFLRDRRNAIASAASWATIGTVLSHSAALASDELVVPPLASPVPTVQLGTLEVSRTIQGYWQLAGGHGKYKAEDAIRNMEKHCKCKLLAK